MKNSLLVKVLAAIALAFAAGLTTGKTTEILGIPWVRVYHLVGQLFLNALTLVVVPLVVSSIISGTARLGGEASFSNMGFSTLKYFVVTGILAVVVGMAITIFLSPGSALDPEALTQITGTEQLQELKAEAEGGVFDKVEKIFYRIIPKNVLSVASKGEMLGLIFFCMVFGFFSSRIEPSLSQTVVNFWNGMFQIMMLMTHLVMKALPIGVFGLMAEVVANTGTEAIKPVGLFFMTVLAGLSLYTFLVIPLLLWAGGKIGPVNHFRIVGPALLTAFTTSSTAATLPVTIECMEKRGNIPNRICSFILPLGTSINLAGTAIYAASAVIFISQAYGLEMNAANAAVIFIMSLFTSLGMVAGIPSASLISIVVILQTLGLPSEGIVLILAVERILDMCRTTVSVFTNTACTALVYKNAGTFH